MNELHGKLDAAHVVAQRNTRSIFGNKSQFKPLAHGEVASDDAGPGTRRLGMVVRELRRILGATCQQLPAGSLAVCENTEGRKPCGKFFIKARKDQRRCSPECARQQSARESNQERRQHEKGIDTRNG